MTRDEKNAMLDKLAIDIATLRADNEARKAARIERGEVDDDDDIAPTTVSKAFGPRPTRQQIAESNAAYQEREQQQQAQPDWNDWFIANFDARIKGYLDLVADEIGAASGDTMKPVLARIAKLEAETALLRSLLDGAVINIKSKANAA